MYKILGSGCTEHANLAENAETAAKELDFDYSVEKVTDHNAIINAGVLMTPVPIVEGEI